jgi:hypothetical protein
MSTGTMRTATRWLLLSVLVLGVVGMHHVAADGNQPSTHDVMSTSARHAPEHPAPMREHDVAHLCLAVLGALSLLLLLWLLVRTPRPVDQQSAPTSAWPRAPDHPPPRGGRDLLSSLCLLRL